MHKINLDLIMIAILNDFYVTEEFKQPSYKSETLSEVNQAN